MSTYDPAVARERHRLKTLLKEQNLKRLEAESHWRICQDHYEYSKDVRIRAERLKKHIKSKFCRKSAEEKEALLQEFLPCDAPFMAANNPEARIRFNRVFTHHLGLFGRDSMTYHVTLTPVRFVMSLEEAKTFDHREIQSWARQELLGFDYVGVEELACYTNFTIGNRPGPFISFHVHVVISDPDPDELSAMLRRINDKHDAFVPGCDAALRKKIYSLEGTAKYLTKEPTNNYRVYPMKETLIDSATGEVTEILTGRYGQNKDSARPGSLLKIREVTSNQHLDKMIFAGGRGVDTLKAIRYDALRDLPYSMRSKRQHEFSGCLPEPVRNTTGSLWTRDYSYQLTEDEV